MPKCTKNMMEAESFALHWMGPLFYTWWTSSKVFLRINDQVTKLTVEMPTFQHYVGNMTKKPNVG